MDISIITDDEILKELEKSLKMIIERETRTLEKVGRRRAELISISIADKLQLRQSEH